jgi:hypothetical protein
MGVTKAEQYNNRKNELQKNHVLKLMELYNLYFDKAKEDSTVFSAFNAVSKELFSDSDESEVSRILNSIKDDENGK